jgi:hypothetical protein
MVQPRQSPIRRLDLLDAGDRPHLLQRPPIDAGWSRQRREAAKRGADHLARAAAFEAEQRRHGQSDCPHVALDPVPAIA